MNGKFLAIAGGITLAVGMIALAPSVNEQDGGRGLGNGDGGSDQGDDGLIFGAGGGTNGWETRPGDIVWTTDQVGINIQSPTAQLDVKGSARFRNNTTFNKNLEIGGKITITRDASQDAMVILNRATYSDPTSAVPQNFIQIFDDAETPFIIAGDEVTDESTGIYGCGDVTAIWNPGDGEDGLKAALFVLDQDDWDDNDTNPYNNTAVVAYLNVAGTWIASDINCKQNIEPLLGATDALMHINGYTYEYKLSQAEIAKGQEPVRVAGLIAQEVIEVLPEAVNVSDSGEHFMNYDIITPLLVEALKEQILLNDANQSRIDDLEARLAALEQGLARGPGR